MGVVDGWVVAGRAMVPEGHGGQVLPLADIPLPGEHNVSNVLAVWVAARADGIPATAVAAIGMSLSVLWLLFSPIRGLQDPADWILTNDTNRQSH